MDRVGGSDEHRAVTRLARGPDPDDGFARLREDVRFLGALLGQVVAESGGSDLYDDVEQLRQAARDARRGRASEAPLRVVEELSLDRAEDVARAFATLFPLVNLAEERHRVRVLRSRDRDDLTPAEDSLAGAFARLAEDEVEARLHEVEIHPVLTAHPTEARRRAVVTALHRIAAEMERRDDSRLGSSEHADAERLLLEDIEVLWRTALLRSRRLEPLDEVRTTMAVFDETLFRILPGLYRATAAAIGSRDGDRGAPRVPAYFRLGSWVGGDRDGNPHVTADVTRATVDIHAEHALRAVENAATRIARSSTMSDELAPPSSELAGALQAARDAHPDVMAEIERPADRLSHPPHPRPAAPPPAARAGRAPGRGDPHPQRRPRLRRRRRAARRPPDGAGVVATQRLPPRRRRRAGQPDLAGRDVRLPSRRARGPPAQPRPRRCRPRPGRRGERRGRP